MATANARLGGVTVSRPPLLLVPLLHRPPCAGRGFSVHGGTAQRQRNTLTTTLTPTLKKCIVSSCPRRGVSHYRFVGESRPQGWSLHITDAVAVTVTVTSPPGVYEPSSPNWRPKSPTQRSVGIEAMSMRPWRCCWGAWTWLLTWAPRSPGRPRSCHAHLRSSTLHTPSPVLPGVLGVNQPLGNHLHHEYGVTKAM